MSELHYLHNSQVYTLPIERLLSKHLCKSKWLHGGIIVKSLQESSLYDAKYDC